MSNKDIIVMFTFSPFPVGAAASNRIFSLALSIQAAGYKVIVLSNGAERPCDYDPTKRAYIYESIEYRNYGVFNKGKIKRTINRNNIFNLINKHITVEERKRIFLVYTTYRNYGLLLHFALKKHFKIPTVVDVTEWHSSSQYKNGKFNLSYILHNLKIRYLLPKAKNIICITTFLDNYFSKKDCNTIIIPPQIMVNKYLEHKIPPIPPVRLFYAGTAAKKDYIDIALDGLCMLNKSELEQVKCTLVGSSLNNFKKQFANAQFYIDTLDGTLEVIDRIPKAEVDSKLLEAHFLILMRPISRYSSAGFPSKVPEALAAGVPIITNLTSDLKIYIEDGKNGIVVEDFTADSFALAVRKAIKINTEEFSKMSYNAYETARKYFNYDVHVNKVAEFLIRCDNKDEK